MNLGLMMLLMSVLPFAPEAPKIAPVLGPFHFSIPVVGLKATDLPKLREAFKDRFDRDAFNLEFRPGTLTCHACASGIEALLRLHELEETLKSAGLRLDRSTWSLKPQQLGICLTAPEGTMALKKVRKAIEAFKGAKITTLGMILDGERLCLVIDLEGTLEYAALDKYLRKQGLKLNDLVWGHWKYGWDIETEHHKHGHDVGMDLKLEY